MEINSEGVKQNLVRLAHNWNQKRFDIPKI
jgi:hypothetical protein